MLCTLPESLTLKIICYLETPNVCSMIGVNHALQFILTLSSYRYLVWSHISLNFIPLLSPLSFITILQRSYRPVTMTSKCDHNNAHCTPANNMIIGRYDVVELSLNGWRHVFDDIHAFSSLISLLGSL